VKIYAKLDGCDLSLDWTGLDWTGLESYNLSLNTEICNRYQIIILTFSNFRVPGMHSNCSTIIHCAGDQLLSYTSEKAVVFSSGY